MGNATRHDLDPEAAPNLGEKAIEIDKAVKAVVTSRHLTMISVNDNKMEFDSGWWHKTSATRRSASESLSVDLFAPIRR